MVTVVIKSHQRKKQKNILIRQINRMPNKGRLKSTDFVRHFSIFIYILPNAVLRIACSIIVSRAVSNLPTAAFRIFPSLQAIVIHTQNPDDTYKSSGFLVCGIVFSKLQFGEGYMKTRKSTVAKKCRHPPFQPRSQQSKSIISTDHYNHRHRPNLLRCQFWCESPA